MMARRDGGRGNGQARKGHDPRDPRQQGHQMEITFLGTSGSWPTGDRNVSATAVRRGGEIILFDCGEGTQRQFQKSDLSHMAVTKIFLTHFHGDHTYGLPGYLKTMQLNERTAPLHVFGPPGIERIMRDFDRVAPVRPTFELTVTAMTPGEPIHFDEGYSVTAAQADHSIRCFAYALEEDPRPGRFDKPRALELGVPEGRLFGKLQRGEAVTLEDGTEITPDQVMGPPRRGRKIVFSGDTRPCQNIIQLARGADILVHEATYTDEHQDQAVENTHSTAREAAQVAKEAGVQTLWLNHYSPRYRSFEQHLKEAWEVFPETHASDDFVTTEVPLPDGASSD